jgi:hypothetical protein
MRVLGGSSGNAQDMFTSEGTGSRRVPSPLLQLCREQHWRLLAAQLPGRGLRAKEPPIGTLQVSAADRLQLVFDCGRRVKEPPLSTLQVSAGHTHRLRAAPLVLEAHTTLIVVPCGPVVSRLPVEKVTQLECR